MGRENQRLVVEGKILTGWVIHTLLYITAAST